MALRDYIDRTAYTQAKKVFQNRAALANLNQGCGGLAKVESIVDGQYKVRLANGTTKLIDPSGVRGMGPDGIIYLSGDIQIF